MSFVREVMSEPGANGTGSFSRVASGFALLNAVGWVWYIVIKTKTIPDLWNCALFVSALYGINRLTQFIAAMRGKANLDKGEQS